MNVLESHVSRQIEHSRDFFWHRVRWRAVAKYLPADRPFTLVDVGAGAGLLGTFMQRDRPHGRYQFVETLPSLVEHLESVYGPDANAAGLEKYRGVDFIALLDVLEHQEDDVHFLSDLAQRMEPGARLIVTVPARMSLWSQWDVNLGHYRRYDKSRFLACLSGLPLKVVELSYLFPEMVPLGVYRHRRWKAQAEQEGKAEFPDLPRIANHVLYLVGSVSLRARRSWPTGTSLFAVLERSDG